MKTPVESLIEALLPFIDRSKVSDTMLQNIAEEHIEMERAKLYDAWDDGEASTKRVSSAADTCVTWYRESFIESTDEPTEPYLKEKAHRKNWFKNILGR